MSECERAKAKMGPAMRVDTSKPTVTCPACRQRVKVPELAEFKRKYHEAMEILSRWGNLDAAEATARLIAAEKTHERAFESVVRINERLARERDEYKRRLDALAQHMAGFDEAI